jgi:hypothetical protein
MSVVTVSLEDQGIDRPAPPDPQRPLPVAHNYRCDAASRRRGVYGRCKNPAVTMIGDMRLCTAHARSRRG